VKAAPPGAPGREPGTGRRSWASTSRVRAESLPPGGPLAQGPWAACRQARGRQRSRQHRCRCCL